MFIERGRLLPVMVPNRLGEEFISMFCAEALKNDKTVVNKSAEANENEICIYLKIRQRC